MILREQNFHYSLVSTLWGSHEMYTTEKASLVVTTFTRTQPVIISLIPKIDVEHR